MAHMGLDLAELNLDTRLRSWYAAGLRHVFAPVQDAGRARNAEHLSKGGGQSEEPSSTGPEAPFPAPWQDVYLRCRPPHPHVWTYWNLCLDLSPQASEARCSLFAKILSSLKWPRENVVFWPLTCSAPSGISPDVEHFWKGIRLLRPRYIICFGLEAFRALCPDRSPDYGSYTTSHGVIVSLPGPEDMLPDNRQAKGLVWHVLQSLSPHF
jgi:hypothetical protein